MSFIDIFNIPDIVTDKTKAVLTLKFMQAVSLYYIIASLILFPVTFVVSDIASNNTDIITGLENFVSNSHFCHYVIFILFYVVLSYCIKHQTRTKKEEKTNEGTEDKKKKAKEEEYRSLRNEVLDNIGKYLTTPLNEDVLKEDVLGDIAKLIRNSKLNIPVLRIVANLWKKFESILFGVLVIYTSILMIVFEIANAYLEYFQLNSSYLIVAFLVYVSATTLITLLKVNLHKILEDAEGKDKLLFGVFALVSPYFLFDSLNIPKPSFGKYPYVLPYKECRGIPEQCKNNKCTTKCIFINFVMRLVSDYEVFRIHPGLSSNDTPIKDHGEIIRNLDDLMHEHIPTSISEIRNSYIVFDKKDMRVSLILMSLQRFSEIKKLQKMDKENPTIDAFRVVEEVESLFYVSILEWGIDGGILWNIMLQIADECDVKKVTY